MAKELEIFRSLKRRADNEDSQRGSNRVGSSASDDRWRVLALACGRWGLGSYRLFCSRRMNEESET